MIVGGCVESLIGNIVKTVRLDPDFPAPKFNPSWVLEEKLFDPTDGAEVSPLDKHMRPILDKDGEDETLTWAGKPKEVTA